MRSAIAPDHTSICGLRPNRSAGPAEGVLQHDEHGGRDRQRHEHHAVVEASAAHRERGECREERVVAQRREQREADQLRPPRAGARGSSAAAGSCSARAFSAFSSNCSVSAMSRRSHSPTRPSSATDQERDPPAPARELVVAQRGRRAAHRAARRAAPPSRWRCRRTMSSDRAGPAARSRPGTPKRWTPRRRATCPGRCGRAAAGSVRASRPPSTSAGSRSPANRRPSA